MPWPVTLLVAVAVLAVLQTLALVVGASATSAVLVATALTLDAAVGPALASEGAAPVAAGLIGATALVALVQGTDSEVKWPRFLVVLALWAFAVAWWWVAILAAPLAILALGRLRPERPLVTAGLVLAVGIMAVAAHFVVVAAMARATAFAPGIDVTWTDALVRAMDTSPRVTERHGVRAHSALGPVLADGHWREGRPACPRGETCAAAHHRAAGHSRCRMAGLAFRRRSIRRVGGPAWRRVGGHPDRPAHSARLGSGGGDAALRHRPARRIGSEHTVLAVRA
jgi:hypothetical protein